MAHSAVNSIKLLVAVGICLAAGGIGSIYINASLGTWYRTLAKPSFQPPDWIFGPVWTALYLLMGIALYLVWRHEPPSQNRRLALTWFGIQLGLNVLWSFLFFRLRAPLLALIEIAFLWLALVGTIGSFYLVSPTAAKLLLPYWIWVTFAAILNFSIWRLNG